MPYHRGKDQVLEFESYKWQFLDALLSRAEDKGVSLEKITGALEGLAESRARNYYSEVISMSSDDFIEMMVLDACFIVELFQQVFSNEEIVNSPIFRKPWLILILCNCPFLFFK